MNPLFDVEFYKESYDISFIAIEQCLTPKRPENSQKWPKNGPSCDHSRAHCIQNMTKCITFLLILGQHLATILRF